jgi:CTP:molybdopterin cytidylyltransferase MocA
LALGDQPHLQAPTLRAVIEFSATNRDKVSQPSFQGHGRHPVILPKALFKQLASAKATTLRDFLRSMMEKVNRIDLNDPGLDLDIDHPADYEKALRMRTGL